MAESDLTWERRGGDKLSQAIVNFTFFLSGLKFCLVQNGDSGAVVASIFKPPQPIEQYGKRLLFADVANDAAHEEETKWLRGFGLCFFSAQAELLGHVSSMILRYCPLLFDL